MALKLTFKLHEIQFEFNDRIRTTLNMYNKIGQLLNTSILYLLNSIKGLVVNDRSNYNMTSYIIICAYNKPWSTERLYVT